MRWMQFTNKCLAIFGAAIFNHSASVCVLPFRPTLPTCTVFRFSTLMPPPPQRVIDGTCAWKYPFCPVSVCVYVELFLGAIFHSNPTRNENFPWPLPRVFCACRNGKKV